MTRDIVWTSKFKKDYKLIMRRNLDISLLDKCIRMIANREELPPKFCDHELSGDWSGYRECHVKSDWLFVHCIKDNDLVLICVRTGSHSDLF